MKMEDGVVSADVQDAAVDGAPCLNGTVKTEEETVRVSPNSKLQNHCDSRDDSDARTSDGEDITPMSPQVDSEKEDTPLISFDVNCVDVNANVDCSEAEQIPLDAENVDNHLVSDAVEMVPCGQGHCEMVMSSLCENISDVSSAHSDCEDIVLWQLDAVPEDCACSPSPSSPREILTEKETSCACDNAKLIALQEKIQQQNCIIERLQLENMQHCVPSVDDQANGETGPDVYELQMAALENAITQLQKETDLYRVKLADQEKIYKSRIQQMEHDANLKFEKVLKQLESALKDKDAMIMKFAQSEKEVLDLAKVRDQLDRKLKSSMREKDGLLTKLKSISSEKSRMHSSLEAKMSELRAAQKENERMKEDVSSRDIKIKWAQNKYKSEFDAHNETRQKVEKLTHKLSEAEEEINKIRSDCQNVILDYQQSEEFKTNNLDAVSGTEPKQQEKYDTEEVSNAFNMIKQELETLKKKHKLSLDENNILAMKVQCLEKERLEYEQNLSKLKENVGILKQECVDLQGKLGEMGNVQSQIEREREKLTVSKTEVERLRQVNIDLQADMDCCHRKEGELLEFAEKLTSKNVFLQSEFSALEANYQSLQLENSSIKKLCEELEMQNTAMVSRLEEETQLRSQETQLLARKLAEKAKYAESINSKLEEERNENAVLRRKMTSSVKELTRELQQTRKKLDLCDVRNGGSDAKSLGSRTSSNCSLDTIMPSTSVALPSLSNTKQDTTEELQHLEPDRHTLIDRIVKLQKSHARKNEKIEFLEEHVSQLQTEVKKKNRLIQNYIMREEAGALSTESMERNKIELSKRGGVMASLYGSRFTDGTMTLELSMEINQKLQAVVEDILLKNITLKENINTLGEEIARLAQDNSTLRYEVRLKT